MSQVNGADGYRTAPSPSHNPKRKRRSPSPTTLAPRPHFENGREAHFTQAVAGAGAAAADESGKGYSAPDSNATQHSELSDLPRTNGSASSLSSAASSVLGHNAFSHALSSRTTSLAHSVTPLTAHSEPSPSKRSSPSSTRIGFDSVTMDTNGISQVPPPPGETAAHRPRPQMLPPPGKAKGYRVVWDPELDSKLSREERKRATLRRREFGNETYPPDPPPDPRLAIPGYMSGNCRAKNVPSKAIMRIAPYTIPPYKIDRHSVGPGEATQVVAYGFDPFLPESTLKLNFSTFGSIALVQNKTDPDTGSFLGIALIKYRDAIRDGEHMTATDSAKRAEAEFNGARIGVHTVRVEVDREGRRFKRHVEHAMKRAREERAKEASKHEPPPPPPVTANETLSAPPSDFLAPPPNAPKGPSGKGAKGPEGFRASVAAAGPAAALNPKSAAAALVEEEPVLSKIKRKPYIFISATAVPVLGTTIPHLKKRLKSYDWREVRLDRTGYYVVFEDSKRGEDESERCFNECNKAALFTYFMEMECQKYGNPNYERSPSPERVLAAKQSRENFERLEREEKEDLEVEKKRRAENFDPVQGALDQLRTELKDKIMSDIKTRIAIPVFHDSLDPVKHVAKRRKLGLPDPMDKENNGPALLFSKAGDSPFQGSKGRHALSHSKPLRPHDPNQNRGRKNDRDRGRGPENVFLDERRRRPAPRRENIRGLHFRLQQLFDEEEDSDDEQRTSITRDTEDQESRPLSRASRTSTPFESESADTPKSKRRKNAEWDEDEPESFDALQKQLLGHLLHKEPEDLATRELELVVNTLPRSSKYASRARTELYIRMRSRDDDDLFQVKRDAKRDFDSFISDIKIEDETPITGTDVKAIKEKVKKKRKTKKQILEEQEELKVKTQKGKTTGKPVDEATTAKIEEKEIELVVAEELDLEHTAWRSTEKLTTVVGDEREVVLDIDGWQDVIKDDEDLRFAKLALDDVCDETAELGDVKLWAWKQKEIKALNTGARGPVEAAGGIEGYFVPNATGCARTEGYHKILNEEKSKYLPHRIKVQKAREERQAQAKANPAAAAEAAKVVAAEKLVSTATSRSNRVNNRRLVNDINLQKQALATSNSDADIAIRFNQLKKRKKMVKFDRSAIHGWGLYAQENIAINDLIIEYVGEKVRQKVADMRELKYDRQGVGSSYLFRMIDDEIIDATKKGGIARFINHSCNPNCTAKIIKVEGTPRIVIYALKDIVKDDELTYDYKFEREYGATDRIPCLCGSANCKGFLN